MLAGADIKLLYEWQAYYELEPFGQEREDIRAATICLTIANAMGMKKRAGGQFKLDDFMPQFGKPEKTTTYDPMTALGILRQHYGNSRKPGSKPNGSNR